jgi:hypothetical protein
MNAYTWFDDLLDQIEATPLALITKFGPWLTPLVPAYFVSRAMVKQLQAPELWGWVAAAALEVVGIAATNSLLRAYQWERERRKTDPAAPIWWNVSAALVYYLTAFLLVFFVELVPESLKLAPAMFVILSGTSALVLALVGDQKRRERLVIETSHQRQADRSAKRQADTSLTLGVSADHADSLEAARQSRKNQQQAAESALLSFLAQRPDATHTEAAFNVNRSRPWVTGKIAEFEAAGVIKKNGNGYEVNGGHHENAL